MKKSVANNYIYNLIFQLLSIIFPIITTPYLARILGAEKIGIFAYTLSISTYFALFTSLGINIYGQREIAYSQDDKKKVSRIFNNLFFIKLNITIIVLILYFLFIFFTKEYKLIYVFWCIELLSYFFDISWFFQGIEQFKKIVFRNLLIKIINIICIFLFIKTKNDLLLYIIIYSFASLAGSLSLWLYLPKYIDFKYTILNIKEFFKYLKILLIFFIPQIATKIYTLLDKVMIGVLVGDKNEVGYYEQSYKIILLTLTIITSLGTVIMPRVANYFSQQKYKNIDRIIDKSFSFVFMLGVPMCIGLIFSAKYLIPLYLGNGFERSITLLMALSPIIIIVGLSNITGIQILIPLKKQKEYNISVVFGAIFNIILNLILIMKYGAIGATVSTIISELSILFIQLYFVRAIIDVKKHLLIIKKYIIPSIILIIVCFLIDSLSISNYTLHLLLLIIAGFFSYFCSLILCKNSLIIEYLYKILFFIKKKQIQK